MARISVLMPFVPRRFQLTHRIAAFVAESRAHRLWLGQATFAEPHQVFAELAGAGIRIPVGTGVTLMPLRHPFEAALQARSLAIAMGHPVVAGFGSGATGVQRALLGKPYDSPLTAAREYLSITRALLDGETLDTDGRYFSMHGAMPDIQTATVEVGLGVLRPRMARVAGEYADAAITLLTPSAYLREVIAVELAKAAQSRGRRTRLVAIVPVAVRRPDIDELDVVLSSNAVYLSMPHYQDMLRRAQIPISGDDRVADAARLVRGGAFLHGSVDEIVEGVGDYIDSGVDEIVLDTTGVMNLLGPKAALSDVIRLVTALTE